jgi:hypothetical protein
MLQQSYGCPILRVFCEGWDATNLHENVYWAQSMQFESCGIPPFANKRKGWGTHSFVAEPNLEKSGTDAFYGLR